MLGFYQNFPINIHLTETFTSTLSRRKLEQIIAQVFQEINSQTFSFEEIGNPTVPDCTVIFEFGIADADGFSFLNEEEAKKLQSVLASESMQVMDWFCGVRYYKNVKGKKSPLRFDYYMIRMNFGEKKEPLEILVFHERGPRYISPDDIVAFIENKINQTSTRKILKRAEQT
jgi:hypothetical protein